MWLEARFSKKQVLELYLNRVYFGAGAYGIEAASQRYFRQSPRSSSPSARARCWLGNDEGPSRYSPVAAI
jgi:penicillin-binding protein 1A